MKVKLFIHHTLEGVEEQVNQWLSHREVSICHITQSQSEKAGKFVFVLSIFYETGKASMLSDCFVSKNEEKISVGR
jgi:hypothetical protein